MNIEHVSVGDLIPFAKNSRTHDDAQVAQIAASIKEFGFTNPILIDEQSGIDSYNYTPKKLIGLNR